MGNAGGAMAGRTRSRKRRRVDDEDEDVGGAGPRNADDGNSCDEDDERLYASDSEPRSRRSDVVTQGTPSDSVPTAPPPPQSHRRLPHGSQKSQTQKFSWQWCAIAMRVTVYV